MNDHQLLEPIGEGANGIVYRVKDMINNRYVAIKEIPYHNDEVIQEINIHLRMHHLLFVPQLLDHYVYNDHSYLVMELIEGQTINQLNINKQDYDWYWKMIYLILLLIQDLHNAGFYHGDLGHRNIMLSNDDRLYLIDFSESGDLSNLRSEQDRRTDIRILPINWYNTRSGGRDSLSPEELTIHNLREEYEFMTEELRSGYKNVNYGQERHLQLIKFCEGLPHEDIDDDCKYITDSDYLRLVIEEYHRIDTMIF